MLDEVLHDLGIDSGQAIVGDVRFKAFEESTVRDAVVAKPLVYSAK